MSLSGIGLFVELYGILDSELTENFMLLRHHVHQIV